MPLDLLVAAPDPCALMTGKVKDACDNTQKLINQNPAPGNSPANAPTLGDAITNPLGSIAQGCAQAAQWVIDHLSDAISKTATVNFTNLGDRKSVV